MNTTPTNDAPVTVEQLVKAAVDAHAAFVTARQRMNATIPALDATPAERAVYDERYRADHAAGREHWRTAIELAQNAHRLAALASAPAGDEVEALQAIFARKPRPEKDEGEPGHRCAHCACRWKDTEGERHGEGCAYVIAAAALARPRAAVGEESREVVEAECAALIAAYYRREIGTLMQQAEHWAENGKPLAVHHRVMKADDYFQIVCQMERDPAKGWKLPFDEIRDALIRKPIKDPGAYPPSKDLYRYRDPVFVVAALQAPPAKVEG